MRLPTKIFLLLVASSLFLVLYLSFSNFLDCDFGVSRVIRFAILFSHVSLFLRLPVFYNGEAMVAAIR
ncbi:hypothetical protein M6B38_267110 [Iris pallida]|uniref:Uncharacterized protein n=1 Tax=Iris pallida TaxID=29817 RepID=A0AAX6FIX3_IRIPA|nr:hypothetical protein M6B38_417035 [Iris pallida]KAJ6849840.1 hypothetical protein M6B38_267110 [Iris pallida]